MRKRLTAALLCLCLLFTLLPATAFAEGEAGSGAPQAGSALCEHHPQHDESCGYTEGTEEVPCTHEHDEDCYKLVTECVHEHTAECYPEESVSENTATPSEAEEAEPTACTHVCSEESGCITKALDCKHEHDEACGYVPATEGSSCTFGCEVCNTQDKDSEATATPSDAQPEECTCETLCTGEEINGDCPVCSAEGAEIDKVCVGAAPMLPVTALAAGTGTDTGKAIQLGTSGIAGYDSAAGYDYIYFGSWTAQDTYTTSGPIKWRVLDDQTNTGETGLFLLSDGLLGTGYYGGVYFDNTSPYSNTWQGSDARTWCQDFCSDNFSAGEQGAVIATTKSDEAFTSSTKSVPFEASENILNGDKVFFLSAEEAENSAYGFANDNARIANYGGSACAWWLRSPYAGYTDGAGAVYGYGYVDFITVNGDWAARPAFNLDLDSVLFTSAAVGGKSASGMDSGLTAVDDYAGSEWKLTLLDKSRSFAVTETTASGKPGDTVTLHYAGATTGTNEYISVIIADSNGSALYYGRVAQPDSANGQVEIKIPASLAAGEYTLNVFSEQYNGDYKTDYASAFAEVALTVEEAAAPGIDTGKAIQLVDSGTVANISGGQADNIYFGTYQQSSDGSGGYNTDPIKWRVLENANGQLFLLSDQNLDVFQYHTEYESVTWETSTMRSWLNGYGAAQNTGSDNGIDYTSDNFINTAFSDGEQGAIVDTTVVNDDNPDYNTEGGENTNDKIFLLSVDEARNSSYFADDNSRKGTNTAYVADGGKIDGNMFGVGAADYWWLRSPGDYGFIAAIVYGYGGVDSRGSSVSYVSRAVRPAFNLDLTSVLFTSAAVGGKSANGMDSGLTAIGNYAGNEWKLTLLDDSRDFSISNAAIEGSTVTFSYSNAKTGENEYISAVIENNGEITHYGRILQLDGTESGASGIARLTLPEDVTLSDTTKLYVFNEQYNGGEQDDTKLTDYASQLIEVEPTVDTTAPTLTAGSATRDSETSATVKFTSDEAGEYYYAVVESGATEPTDIVSGDSTNMASGENTINLTNLTAGAKDIYIVAKDAVENVSQTLKIVIPEFIPTYTISASPAALNFSNKTVGYTEAPDGQTVTITNTGNQTVTVTLPTSTNYTITAETGFVDGTATLAPNGTATFAVQPKTGLAVGSYSETLTISSNHNTSAEVSLAFTVDPKSLDGAQVQVSGSYIYDGNAKEPSGENVTVTLDGEPLTENNDYTLSYENNTDAGEATVKVSGKGNYSGTVTGTFQIAKAAPTVSDVAVSSPETIYDTTDISSITLSHASTDTPGTVALDAGQTLTVGTRDYTWTFTPDDANNYTTATGSITLTVVEDTVKSIAVTKAPDKTTYTYGDSLDTAGMVVTATCESGKTKDVTDRVTVSPETLTTSVTVLTISYGELTTTQFITVNPKEVSNPSIELSGTSFEFTGEAITPTVVSVKDGETVIPETEYTVSYSNNVNVGTNATVTITDKEGGNYTVSGSTTFQITKVVATVTQVPTANTLTYTGQPQTLVMAGTATGGTMQYSTEENGPYDTAIPTGTNAGEYTVWYKVAGDANHSDTQPMEVKVTISQASIAEAEVTLSPESFTYNGQSQTPTVTVKLNGNALTEGDYTVTYSGDTTNVGTVTVTVTGKGNYSGTATEKPTYTINPAPLTISGATLADKTYDGTTAATVTDVTFDGLQNGKTLTLGNDYTATAKFDTADAGTGKTATVTVTLKNDNYTLESNTYQLTGQTIAKAAAAVDKTPAATPAPTATPAPAGTVYYTCPACGHHDWTATDTGYRCDTCGYVESLKQLAGYGNVKGVYEPKTTGSAAAGTATAAVPQTGDESNPALWLGLLLLSGLALGGITLYRRKKTQ